MPDDIKKESVEIIGWAPFHDKDGKYYEEKIFSFYNAAAIFFIKSVKRSKTTLSFAFPDGVFHCYKVKGNIDYAKKIAENTFRLFENSAFDFYDVDLCLRKTFSLKHFKSKNKGE